MAKRKSSAQLKRLQKRAEQRGETYDDAGLATEHKVGDEENQDNDDKDSGASSTNDDHPPATTTKNGAKKEVLKENDDLQDEELEEQLTESSKRAKIMHVAPATKAVDDRSPSAIEMAKKTVAMALKGELKAIEENKDLKAKERRSAKRKAEAIAMEKTGVSSAQDLLDWLETYNNNTTDTSATRIKNIRKKLTEPDRPLAKRRGPTPNILFVGQLSFDTTKEDILTCFLKHLRETEKMDVAKDALSVRLLTHSKTGKSKGMAFVEIKDVSGQEEEVPLILYSCLKLHHSYLKGRRINVERTSGGGKATKQTKVATLRKNQVDYMKETVQSILAEYDTSTLDEGVLALCERHNATVVHAGMERFVETDGPNKENPSAYLTALLQKLATEGIFDRTQPKSTTTSKNDRHDTRRKPSTTTGRPSGRPRSSSSSNRGGRK